LGQALRWGRVARNVATLVDPPRIEDHEIEPLSPKQAQAFLKSISGDRLEALYSVALAVGLRKGEALGLRWGDIDLEKGFLTVRWSLQRINGQLSLT
jgi:integrase